MNTTTKNKSTSTEKNAVEGGVLYLVATPIGNLSDISERALKVLSEVDFVAAEDTRNSGLLLSRFGIQKPMISYFEHNKHERGETIIARIAAGESCALITDAGTPAISDPGEDIVRECHNRGIRVTSIPGCCAAVTALTLSGLPTGRFTFEGFISTQKAERRERLAELSTERRTMIIYEAPHRLRATLDDLYKYFGDRKITICREITKLNEEVMCTTINEAVNIYKEREPRGEYVLIVDGINPRDIKNDYPEDIAEHVQLLINSGLSKMDAVKTAARIRGVPKNDVYQAVIRNNDNDQE